MPDDVREALIDRGVLDLDRNRPAFRRNDDLGRIDGASRIDQMLDEGAYTVAWRGIGDDGHVVRNDFGFRVTAGN